MSVNAIEHRAARAPIAPVLRRGSLRPWRKSTLPALLDGSERLLTTSGRAALALAFEQLAICAGDEVLMPAYHCLAMRAPVLALGALPVFYRLGEDLSIDIADISPLVTARTRCIVAVHFFGFPQPLEALRELCDRSRTALIEDCAHAFYGPRAAQQIGRCGDFAVGSLMKFFPVFDGGCLVSFRRPLTRVRLRSRGLLFQLKAALHVIECAANWSRGGLLGLIAAASARAAKFAKRAHPGLTQQLAQASPGAALGSLDFQPEWVHTRISLASRFILGAADHRHSIARRRQIFSRLLAGLSALRAGRPLYSSLPEGVVPYVFPMVLADPAVSFDALRAAGVPMYRWEDVAEETCATARFYKARLVQFPCHQSLTDVEVAELIETIARVLNTSALTTNAASAQDVRP